MNAHACCIARKGDIREPRAALSYYSRRIFGFPLGAFLRARKRSPLLIASTIMTLRFGISNLLTHIMTSRCKQNRAFRTRWEIVGERVCYQKRSVQSALSTIKSQLPISSSLSLVLTKCLDIGFIFVDPCNLEVLADLAIGILKTNCVYG